MQCHGRGSWIRTNDLKYPKLPRYQTALYPELVMPFLGGVALTRGARLGKFRIVQGYLPNIG